MKIRKLTNEDFKDLDSFFGSDTRYKNPISKWEGYLSDQETGARIVKVVETDQQVVGICTLKFKSAYLPFSSQNIPEISDLIVADKFQGREYGKALLLALIEKAKELGYKQVGLGVGLYADYGKAQRLYVKLGFIPDGKGATYKEEQVIPGEKYPFDDDLLIWFTKEI